MSAMQVLTHARTFESLRKHRNYRLYFSGQVVSITGTWVQNVAQSWLVIELSHSSPLAVGVLAACQFGPYAVLGLLGGVIVDRFDYRRTLMFTQSAMMCTAAVLGVLALTHVAAVWMVDLIAAMNGVVLVVDTPVRQSFTFQMVGRRELPNAVALNSSLFNSARIMGPALGGVIIATVGVGICFLINAVSFIAVLVGLALMAPAELYPVQRADRGTSMVAGIREGLQYARNTPRVRMVLVMLLVVATFGVNFNVLLPVLARSTLHSGAEVFGLLSSAFGAGALTGALITASMGRALVPVLVAAAGAFGLFEVLLAFQASVAGAAIVLALVGVSFSLYTANSNSTIQLTFPDQLRGLAMGLYGYVFIGTAPLGGLLIGWLADQGGTRLAFLIGGASGILASLYGLARTGVAGQARRRVARRWRRGGPVDVTSEAAVTRE